MPPPPKKTGNRRAAKPAGKKRHKPARRRKAKAKAKAKAPAVAQPVVYVVSLGCPKNQVDSERLVGFLLSEGFLLTSHPGDADLALVNTCAFIEPARAETLEVLAELQGLKKNGRLRAVVATGCYPQKSKQIPGADLTVRFRDYPRLAARCRAALGMARRKRHAPAPGVLSSAPRLRFGLKASAYLKISEGCDNRCAYCTIPEIRGRLRSRPMREVLDEARQLLADGAREIILVAQDTAAYGTDLSGGEPQLAQLMRELLKMEGFRWLRLMYAHPAHITDEVLELFNEGRVADYLDMPIQHADDEVLEAMGRGYSSDDLRRIVSRIRRVHPQLALRTTCIVGFPGETPPAFARLRTFLIEARFDHLGVFTYYPEPGTRAARRKNQVSERTKQKRREELMGIQKLVASGRGLERIGDHMTVLMENLAEGPAVGRSEFQAPDVDGKVIVTRPHAGLAAMRPGEFHRVIITGAYDYDLVARLI